MICNFAKVTQNMSDHLLAKPEDIHSYLYGNSEMVTTEVPRRGIFGLFGFKDKKVEFIESESAIEEISEEDQFDIDKSWHSMHFLFTGSAWEGDFPQAFLVNGGMKVGKEDVGYGEARIFTLEDTCRILNFLRSVDRSEMKPRLDPKLMKKNEIYPNVWNDNVDLDEEWSFVEQWMTDMIAFISQTVDEKRCLMVYIN